MGKGSERSHHPGDKYESPTGEDHPAQGLSGAEIADIVKQMLQAKRSDIAHEAEQNRLETEKAYADLIRYVEDHSLDEVLLFRRLLAQKVGWQDEQEGDPDSGKDVMEALREGDRKVAYYRRLVNTIGRAFEESESSKPATPVSDAHPRYPETWADFLSRYESLLREAEERSAENHRVVTDTLFSLDVLDDIIRRYLSGRGRVSFGSGPDTSAPLTSDSASPPTADPRPPTPESGVHYYYSDESPLLRDSTGKTLGKWQVLVRWIMNRVAECEARGLAASDAVDIIDDLIRVEVRKEKEARRASGHKAGDVTASIVGAYFIDKGIDKPEFHRKALDRVRALHREADLPGKRQR